MQDRVESEQRVKEMLKSQNLEYDSQMSKLRDLVQHLILENQRLRDRLRTFSPKDDLLMNELSSDQVTDGDPEKGAKNIQQKFSDCFTEDYMRLKAFEENA